MEKLDAAMARILDAPTDEVAAEAAEEIWASGEQGLLYVLRSCFPQASSSRDAVQGFLQTLLSCPSARKEEFMRSFMLVWCSNDPRLAKLGLRLLDLRSIHGDFYDPKTAAGARKVGVKASKIGGFEAMQKLYYAIEWLVGTDNAYGLTFAWDGVGGWMA